MANKRLQAISKGLNDRELNVIQNRGNNGIICKGFYIYDKGDYYRIWQGGNYLDLNNGSSIVDLIANNSFIGEAV